MRTIDDIIADSSKTLEAALREAFEAGHAHAASDLKSKMTAFFDGLVQPVKPHDEPQPLPQQSEPHIEPHTEPHAEQHYD